MNKVTPANEDYLEAIYELHLKNGSVRSVDIATRLDVSKASVNKAVGTLKDAGLVEQAHYGEVRLTSEGAKYGESILDRHELLRKFLTKALGVEPETAEHEACEMEHAISDTTLKKWAKYVKEQGI